MAGLKLALRGMAIFLFMPLAALTAFSFALNRTITQQDYIKNNLRDSGIYSAVSLQAQNSFLQDEQGNPVPDPIKKAVAEAITPLSMQSIIEPLIDTTYTVLDNPDELMATTINIAPLKKQFSSVLNKQIASYVKTLPACSESNLPKGDDLAELSCRPPGVSSSMLAAEATKQIMASPQVPKDTIKLGQVLGKDKTASGFVSQLSGLLHWTRLSIFISGALFLLAVAAILVLSDGIRAGVHRLTTLLLTVAILFAGTSGLFLFALQRVNFDVSQTLTIESSLGSSLRLLALEIFKTNLYFAVIYGVLGIIMLIGLYATEKKNPTAAPAQAN